MRRADFGRWARRAIAWREDAATGALVERINDEGRIYLTGTRVAGRPVIRFQVGRFDSTRAGVEAALPAIRDAAGRRASSLPRASPRG